MLVDMIFGMFAMSLNFYVGLKLYRINFDKHKFIKLIALSVVIIAGVRVFVSTILLQTVLGVTILILGLRYYFKKSWFSSIIPIVTVYSIIFMMEIISIDLITYITGVPFKEVAHNKNFVFYLYGLGIKSPILIMALVLYYTDFYIADLRQVE
ncbi:hypothetical protein [Halanaerobacter jeridensis]|uniref:Uncharacterized protein n=1 Tax=Halanaerobacter jeridensis TaxID=706427 RepID=A0A939BQQ2_9FIRM|nr:hypothetical protein [Halanaerobacter jeridensis]MBM7556584.1 hypothetical protein [Halanaerobacter jeridensis]